MSHFGMKQHLDHGELTVSLDRQTVRSEFIGNNSNGRPMFNTFRTPIGEALFQLKSNGNKKQVAFLANEAVEALKHFNFDKESRLGMIAMPPSKQRAIQPVSLVAKAIADILKIKCSSKMLTKNNIKQMKDLNSYQEKYKALENSFSLNESKISAKYDIILFDDLFETGATLKRAIETLAKCKNVGKVYGLTLTRTKNA